MTDTPNPTAGFVFILIGLSIYLLPYIIAKSRRMANRWSIFFLNLFLGWTLIGWVVSLCWSVSGTAEIKDARA